MTEAELSAIEERAAYATPGPWELIPGEYDAKAGGVRQAEYPYDVIAAYARVYPECAIQLQVEDAAFIAAARADVPRLCEALREAWSEIARLRSLLPSPCPHSTVQTTVVGEPGQVRRCCIACGAVRVGEGEWEEAG
jgi:hypothetical protein